MESSEYIGKWQGTLEAFHYSKIRYFAWRHGASRSMHYSHRLQFSDAKLDFLDDPIAEFPHFAAR
jgi:hypothetical protein